MKTLIEIKIRVVPREIGENQLTEAQRRLATDLVAKTISRGNWARARLAGILKEEMRFTSRHIGGVTAAEIETLLNGVDITYGDEPKEEENAKTTPLATS